MNVVLLSMFSTSMGYLSRYFDQVEALRGALEARNAHLRLVLCEGDSQDETWFALWDMAGERGLVTHLFQQHHGNQVYGSIEEPARFAQLSRIWNEMLERVTADDDVAVLVESDLIWEPATMLRLIRHAQILQGVVCPMVMQGDTYFRDVWAYRCQGRRFTNEPPYHPALNGALLELDSAGSCLAMPAEALMTCRTTEEEELVGFCKQARERGYRIWLDARLRVEHPPDSVVGHPDRASGHPAAIPV